MKIIAIDPDLSKCGVAKFENNKLMFCDSIPIWEVFEYLLENRDCIVLLEAGHLQKQCWHSGGRGASSNVGKGKAIGVILAAFMNEKKITYRNIKPAGYSNFFKNKEFFKCQTGWKERTNLDARAAAAIGFLNK